MTNEVKTSSFDLVFQPDDYSKATFHTLHLVAYKGAITDYRETAEKSGYGKIVDFGFRLDGVDYELTFDELVAALQPFAKD